MQVHVLASGSTGNATLLHMGDARILIDAGVSARRIKTSLAAIGTAIEDIDGIFITHEHRDHISGLPALARKYRLPVYTRPATWAAMYCREELPAECRKPLADSQDIGGVKIEPFTISHDAAEPVGFTLYHHNIKCSVATDLGFVTATVKKALDLSDVLILEANHDLAMLKNGSYPWRLKQRILGSRGHLSNHDAGWTLARTERRNRQQVFLAHLSKENNRPDIAQTTVCDILTDQGCQLGVDLDIHLTHPNQTASWEKSGKLS